jgi:hypothetical protein
MAHEIFSIRPSPLLRDFLDARVQPSRGARGPWTRAGALHIAIERYQAILDSVRLPEPPPELLPAILKALAPYPIPVQRLPTLPSLLLGVLSSFTADPATIDYLRAIETLQPAELAGLAESLEARYREDVVRR